MSGFDQPAQALQQALATEFAQLADVAGSSTGKDEHLAQLCDGHILHGQRVAAQEIHSTVVVLFGQDGPTGQRLGGWASKQGTGSCSKPGC